MNRFLSKFTLPIAIAKIIAKHEPLYMVYVLPQIIFNAALPLLYVYFPRLIIEQLTSENYNDVIRVITLYVCILLFINISNVFMKNKSEMHATLFSSKIRNEIGKISMDFELKDIESVESRDTIQVANKASEITSAMGIVQGIIANAITIAGLAYIIIQLDLIFVLLVIAVLVVRIFFVRVQHNFRKKTRSLEAANSRHVEYLLGLAYWNEGGAKEIRLNSMQNWYMNKTTTYRNEMLSIQYKSFRMYAYHNIVTAIILALQSFFVLWMLSTRFIDNTISIAEFTMYFSAVAVLTGSLLAIAEQYGSYNQQILNVSDYKRFMNKVNTESSPKTTNKSKPQLPEKIEIVFKNISFNYPNVDKQVLNNVNIKISDKEKLVIVGMNGAGKSTFIKLLCKFYRPTCGVITLNGVDIWDIPNEDYYEVISAVFQDFANLSFTLKENVAMNEDTDIERIDNIISDLGLKEMRDELPCGYETYVTKSFDANGVEFSGGQSQKIAIARAVYHNTPIIILDEPTANLDPKAESEIYTDFFKIAKNKTTIFISHRLAASTIADNIAVFSEGMIVEYGTHNDLVEQNGIYADMYRKQSRQYDEKVIF